MHSEINRLGVYLHETLVEAQVVPNRVFPALVGLQLVVRKFLLDPLVNVGQGSLQKYISFLYLYEVQGSIEMKEYTGKMSEKEFMSIITK